MTEPRRTSIREFLEWLESNLSPEAARYWKLVHAQDWQSDSVYQYWEQNVKNQGTPQGSSAESAITQKIPYDVLKALKKAGYLDRISQITTLDELEAIIDDAVKKGIISSYDVGDLVYDTYALQVLPLDYLKSVGIQDEALYHLTAYKDKDDLSQRIKKLKQIGYISSIDENSLYSALLAKETPYEASLKKLRAQQETEDEKQRTAYEKQLADEEKENLKQQEIAAPYRAQALSDVANSPYITNEDRAKYRDLPVDQFTAVMRSIHDERAKAAGGMTRAESIIDKKRAGREYGQAGQAFLNAFNNPPSMQREGATPPMPSFMPVVEEFRKGIGYGEGTRLRSFLESELPEAVAGAQGARQAWWARMNRPEPTSYESERSRLGEQTSRYANLFQNAPTESVIGGVYYGEGGPAAIARAAFESSFDKLYSLRPDQFGRNRPPVDEEDPLKGVLEKLKVGSSARYFRQPGTGINPRLAPSVRFR